MSALPSKTDIQIESNPRCEEALRLVRAWGAQAIRDGQRYD